MSAGFASRAGRFFTDDSGARRGGVVLGRRARTRLFGVRIRLGAS